MTGFVFKIMDERNEEVFREIMLPTSLTFEDFHFALLDAFELDAGEMASFYISDNQWQKNKEITLMDMGMSEEGKGTSLMSDNVLGDVLSGNEDKLLYVYDFLFCKNFKVVLTSKEIKSEITPSLVQSKGDYVVDNSGFTDLILGDLEEEETPKTSKKDKKTPDIMDGFDEFDNFQDDSDEPQFENIDDLDI